MFLLTLGLFMKVFLADSLLAGPLDVVFGAGKDMEYNRCLMGVRLLGTNIF